MGFIDTNAVLNLASIRDFAAAQNVAPGIVVGQLQNKKYLLYSQGNGLKQTFRWA